MSQLRKEPRKDYVPPEEDEPILSRLTSRSNRLIFFLLIGLLVAVPFMPPSMTVYTRSIILLAIVAMTVLWIIGQCSGLEGHLISTILNPPVLMLGTYAIVRYGLTEVESVARHDVLMILAMTLLFFVVTNVIRHRSQYGWLVTILVGSGVLISIEGFWQLMRNHWGHIGVASTVVHEVIRGTFANPSEHLAYLHLVFPLAAADFLFSRRHLSLRILEGTACIILIAGMLVTGHFRHLIAPGASVIVLTAYLLRKRGWKFRWAMAGMLAIVLVGGLALWAVINSASAPTPRGSMSVEVSHPVLTPPSKTATNSEPDWRSSLALALHNPWLGVGPGMLPLRLPAAVTATGKTSFAFLAEYGVAGIAIALWIIGAFIVATIWILATRAKRYSAATASNRYAFAVAGLAVAAAVLVDMALTSGFHAYANQVAMVTIAAATMVSGIHNRGEAPDSPRARGRRTLMRLTGLQRVLLTVGSCVALVLLLWMLRHSLPADILTDLAQKKLAAQQLSDAESLFEKVVHYDSRNSQAMIALGDICLARDDDDDHKKAIMWYERALVLNPHARALRPKLARLYDENDDREKAAEQYLIAVNGDPLNTAYHIAFAQHHLRWKDFDAARESYRKAAALAPDVASTLPTITQTNASVSTAITNTSLPTRSTNRIAGIVGNVP